MRLLVPGLAAVFAGVVLGILGYTFIYARGYSYLSNNPSACKNCHVMNEQYDAWQKSSHHSVAVCNDCHTPPGFFGKYATKALNGFFHSLYFTTGNFHEPIMITPRNSRVTERACLKCHAELAHAMLPDSHCAKCHLNVGHMH